VTSVRSAPGLSAPSVDLLADAHRHDLDRLVASDPIANAVIAARLAGSRTIAAAQFGGALLGSRTGLRRRLTGAAFAGGNLLPIAGREADWLALAHHLSGGPRSCTSIVGPATTVLTMWPVLEPAWGPPRVIRADQPLLVLGRDQPRTVRPHPGVRIMRPADLERYLPAAAAMFTEELGISPFAGANGASYRSRVESLLATGRAFGIVDPAGRMIFKADIGALTAHTCQVQGVWVRPDRRGHGLGTAALAAVLERALRLAPTASLYVNGFNVPARRMYAKLGLRQVATLATVLF
jgi:predicted GNAT family acetyltransferase